jgi:very-long-chain enoyl-CoA reductase
MLIIYVPALCYCLYYLPTALTIATDHADRPLIIGVMLTIHFLKRTLETLFLHKYSGSTDLGTAIFIGIYYTLVSIIVSYFSVQVPVSLYDKNILTTGITLFIIGQIGNFYHHYILASLRKDKLNPTEGKDQIKNYKIPVGGLFDYVTMPHYFFELISWLGIALTSQQANSFLVFCSMFSYLAGRSVATNQWYKDNIKDYPQRKNLIPFIF